MFPDYSFKFFSPRIFALLLVFAAALALRSEPVSAQSVPLVELLEGGAFSYTTLKKGHTKSLGDRKVHAELVSLAASFVPRQRLWSQR